MFPWVISPTMFQSTLPTRGATFPAQLKLIIYDVSIHAPHTGSDVSVGFKCPHCGKFQSTLPTRGATPAVSLALIVKIVSIHAPHTGSDADEAASSADLPSFNPRSPHGERPRPARISIAARRFNPRSPHGERRARGYADCSPERVSIHAPHTGSDWLPVIYGLAHNVFQSTLPTRGATSLCYLAPMLQTRFNPRSPHGERLFVLTPRIRYHCFNPRSPHGERHHSPGTEGFSSAVSIHAPHTGSDEEAAAGRPTLYGVSIHAPHTGSDRCGGEKCRRMGSFNPRSPHGERRGLA